MRPSSIAFGHAGNAQAAPVHRCAILVLLSACSLQSFRTAAAATCNNATYTLCPSASTAALSLTGGSSLITVSNATYTTTVCDPAIGLITSWGSPPCHYLGPTMPGGALILSTGNASFGTTPSNTNGGNSKQNNATQSLDPDLTVISSQAGYPGMKLYDTAILEFDFTTTISGPIGFQYVFGSEEYPEYAPPPNTSYNDIFGFWISLGASKTNVALLPGTSTPVGIATVNPVTNPQYFVNNWPQSPAIKDAEMDGLTVLMNTATCSVTAGQQYHVKLAIADGGDNKYDSMVYLKYGSFSFMFPPPPPPSPPPPPPSPPPTPAPHPHLSTRPPLHPHHPTPTIHPTPPTPPAPPPPPPPPTPPPPPPTPSATPTPPPPTHPCHLHNHHPCLHHIPHHHHHSATATPTPSRNPSN
eukprot:jgi/Chrzof1/5949/Cz16g21190.t1